MGLLYVSALPSNADLVRDIYNWVKSQNLKFDARHGCLVGGSRHLVKKLALQHENEPRNPSAQDLKLQWEIHILTFLDTDRNAPFFFKSGQTENTQK